MTNKNGNKIVWSIVLSGVFLSASAWMIYSAIQLHRHSIHEAPNITKVSSNFYDYKKGAEK